MRTDPRAACANEKELLGWAVVHDLLAHPFMAITNYSALSMRFHDWTSYKAWPRVRPAQLREPVEIQSKWGVIRATEVAPNCWKIRHPVVRHALVTGADDAIQAVEKAEVWFQDLEETHGGVFAARSIA